MNTKGRTHFFVQLGDCAPFHLRVGVVPGLTDACMFGVDAFRENNISHFFQKPLTYCWRSQLLRSIIWISYMDLLVKPKKWKR